ncbi:MAG: polyprenyl synthetase family protein [Mycobacteriaceae bacterium]
MRSSTALTTAQPWRLPAATAARLDTVMDRAVADLAGPLTPQLRRILGAGGQRLRPALTLAVSQLGRSSGPDAGALERAAAVELLHCATLVHDDLIDGADVRRGTPTVNAAEGLGAAVLSGDLLIAAAYLVAGRAGDGAGTVIARTLASLCRGEALEALGQFDAAVGVPHCLEVIRLKTGSLLAAACLLGAQAADLDSAATSALAKFGMHFGISLQLLDDVIDVVSTPLLAGKPVGVDFSTGTVTVPAALALTEFPELGSLLRPGLDDLSRRRALALLRTPSAVRSAVAMAAEHAEAAGSALRRVDLGDPALEELADWPVLFLQSQLRSKVDAGGHSALELQNTKR